MKRSDLINKIQQLYPFLQEEQAASVVELVFTSLTEGLSQGRRAEIRGFGSFSAKTRKVQLKFSTQADVIELGSKRSISFRLSKEISKRLNAANDR